MVFFSKDGFARFRHEILTYENYFLEDKNLVNLEEVEKVPYMEWNKFIDLSMV